MINQRQPTPTMVEPRRLGVNIRNCRDGCATLPMSMRCHKPV